MRSGAFLPRGQLFCRRRRQLNGGLEDINEASGVTTSPISFVGTYTLAADGRGTMKFSDGRTCRPAISTLFW